MKKVFSVIFLFCLCLLSLASCGDRASTDSLKIVATNFPSYDFARQLTNGTDTELIMLLSPGSESHSYDPTPKDIVAIGEADLFVCVGGSSDFWVTDVLASAGNDSLKVFRLTEHAELFFNDEHGGTTNDEKHGEDEHDHGEKHGEDEHDHGEKHSEDEHDHGEAYDEHVWTSPKNVMGICRDLCEVLKQLDPESADSFSENLEDYLSELERLDADIRSVIAEGKHDSVVFADRFPLIYFVREYSLDYLSAFPGCSSAVEVSAGAIAALIDRVNGEGLPAVLHIELSNTDVCKTVAEACGVQMLQFNACHNLTADQFDSGETYLSLMRENVDTLRIALG